MRKGLKRAAALLMIVALLLSACPLQIVTVFAEGTEPAPTATVTTVTVVLTDKITKAPVDGAEVKIGENTATTDTQGEAEFTLALPAENEEPISYPVVAEKAGYASGSSSVELSYGMAEAFTCPIEMVPVADLTVNVYYCDSLLTDEVAVTLSGSKESTAMTTGGIAVFNALPLDGSYRVSVKPSSITGTYYVSNEVDVKISGSGFEEARLDVQKKTSTATDLSFSIADAGNGSDVTVLRDDKGVTGLNFALYRALVEKSSFWNDKVNHSFDIVLDSNEGKAFLSDENGIADPAGRYLTVTAVTGETPIGVTVSEKSNDITVSEQKYTIKVNKADAAVIYKVYGVEVSNDTIVNFASLRSQMPFTAEGSFETEGEFTLRILNENEALELDSIHNSITNLKATLDETGEVIAVPVSFTRQEDAWYNAASLSLKVQSCRAERPESGFGSVSYNPITVQISNAEPFSVVPVINTKTEPANSAEEQDSTPKITYKLEEQKIYHTSSNDEVTDQTAQLVTIAEDGTATINTGYYGTAKIVATIERTDCFLEKEVDCQLTVNKDMIDQDEKPFTLTYMDEEGQEQTLDYTFDPQNGFVAGADWIKHEITLKPANGYTVKCSGSEVPADGIALDQGEVTTALAFAKGIYQCDGVNLYTKSDWTAPEVSYTLVSEAFEAFKEVAACGIAVFSGDISVKVTATDEGGSEVGAVYVYVGEEKRDVTENRETTISVAEIQDKTQITAEAIDVAGNSAASSTPESLPDGTKPNAEDPFYVLGDTADPNIKVELGTPYNYLEDQALAIYSDIDASNQTVIKATIEEANYSLTEQHMSVKIEKTGEGDSSSAVKWNEDSSVATINVGELADGEYTLTISYTDVANNPAAFEAAYGSSENGTYTYAFRKDTTDPEIEVELGTPYNYLEDKALAIYSDVDASNQTVIKATIVEANYSLTEHMSVKLEKTGEGDSSSAVNWNEDSSVATINVAELADGEYTLTISYTDIADYPAAFDAAYGSSENGTYTYAFRKDTKAPVVSVSAPEKQGETGDGVNAYKDQPTIEIKVTEQFYTASERVIQISRNGEPYETGVGDAENTSFTPTESGLYTVSVSYQDAAGHGHSGSYTFLYNNAVPEISAELSCERIDVSNADSYNGNPTLSVTISNDLFYQPGNAKISLRRNGESVEAEFDENGNFAVDSLQDGYYELTASYKSAPGVAAVNTGSTLGTVTDGELTYCFYVDNTEAKITYEIDSDAGVSFLDVVGFGLIATSKNAFNITIIADDGEYGSGIKSLNLNEMSLYSNENPEDGIEKSVEKEIVVTDVQKVGISSLEGLVYIDGGTPVTAVATAEDFAGHTSTQDRPNDSPEEAAEKEFQVLSDQTAPAIRVELGKLYNYLEDQALAIYSDVDASDQTVITASIEEANYSLTEHMSVKLEKTGKGDSSSAVQWNKDFTEATVDVGTLEDGWYTLTISYTDIAGNPAAFEAAYGSSENGTYTYSFVKDTVAPEIKVDFSEEAVGSFSDIPVYSEKCLPTIRFKMTEANYSLTERVTVSCKEDDGKELGVANGTEEITFDIGENQDGQDVYADGVYTLSFEYKDVAGHEPTITVDGQEKPGTEGKFSYKFIKDTAKPVCNGITLANRQDTINGMEFYKGSTTGTATVTEQFFNKEHFILTANEQITAAWEEYPTNPVHGSFTLNGDGHYTLALTGSDDAGHSMERYQYPNTVVLDSTAPVISMSTPNPVKELNGSRYFDSDITCTIEINERNFYNSHAVQVTCTRDGESYPIGGISWSGGGAMNHGTFGLSEEGKYRISISYTDPSKNSGTYTCDYAIVIDKTAPAVTIADGQNKALEDETAYNSPSVSFRIELEDQNLLKDDILVELTGWVAKEDENGVLVLEEKDFSEFISDISVKEEGRAYQISIRNLETDAVYTLHVSGKDLSGNSVDETRVFSVNRDGSTYFIDGETAELVKNYYTHEAHDIEIHEVCVEELKTTDISISHNLDVVKYELEKQGSDKRFDVTEQEDCKWNEYLYQVMSTNFEEQGTYSVATSSVAKGTEMKKSSSEVVAVNFLMDTTVPTINVAGIEDGGRYQTDAQEITITCQDDQMLQHVEIWLDETLLEEVDFSEEMLSSKDITVKIPGENEYREQQLRVVVQDKAGNEPTETTIGVFVSTNFWYLYRNYILIGGGILLAALAVVAVLLKKRKKA